MISLELGFIICLFLSAFFSAAEMAFVSANKIRMREKAYAGHAAAKKVIELQQQPHYFLTAVLIGNNIANIVATAILTYIFQQKLGIANEWMITAITAPLLIILGETVPKDYGRLRSDVFLLRIATALHLLVRFFRLPASLILKMIDRIPGSEDVSADKSIFVSEKEFRSLIEESTASGLLAQHEKKLIDTILDFERIHVESVMIPVEKVAKVDISETVGSAKGIARASHSRMILVYEEIPSLIVGMIYVFDLLFETQEDRSLKNFLRSPIFLPANTSIEKAFLTLQQKRQSFAVVTDPSGEVIGVVPIDRLFNL